MKTRYWFRKSQTNSKGKGTIYGTITINQERSQPFSTGIQIDKSNWDTKRQQVTGKNYTILNDELTSITNALLTIKQSLQAQGKEVTANAVRAEWLNKQEKAPSIFILMDEHEKHQRLYGTGKKGKPLTEETFEFYSANRAYFTDYTTQNKNVDTNPEHINSLWLTKYDKFLRTRTHKKKLNATSVKLAIGYLKHVLRIALANERIQKAPALYFKSKAVEPTAPKPLSAEEIQTLQTHTFKWSQQNAVDCFLFLRYTGLHYIDGKKITSAAIRTDETGTEYLFIERQKTKEPALIPYHPEAKRLAEKYNGIGCLPFKGYSNFSEQLRIAAKEVGIRENITPGTARDTFADDCANNMGMSDESLAAMLGHTTTGQVKKYRRISIDRITKEWKA
ncbi:phage integrase SAM-like domain-containing protein [Spirosoma litoris]